MSELREKSQNYDVSHYKTLFSGGNGFQQKTLTAKIFHNTNVFTVFYGEPKRLPSKTALQNDTNVCLSFNNPHPANQIPEISIMKQKASMHQISHVHE